MGNIYSIFNYILSFFYNPEESIDSELNDFYYLSLIREQDGIFSIHGLWPQSTIDSYPEYCKKVKFDITKLNSIIVELGFFWYSTEEKNEDFWKHEWEKHGSCAWEPMTELDYFSQTLRLYHSALENKLQIKYFNPKTQKCLIPVNKEFEFINL